MPNLETVVRPAQTPSVRPPPVAASNTAAPPAADDNLTEIGGGQGQVTELRHSISTQITYYFKQKETRRTVDVVRVKNKDNKEQYIDVEVTKELQLRNQLTNADSKLQLRPPDLDANMEVIKKNLVKEFGK
jgi:hypothetical protein